MRRRSKVCLATATTTDSLPGTVAMIGSFLRCHPAFDGDVVVIEHQLEAESKKVLQAAFGVRFLAVGQALLQAAKRLQAQLPRLRVSAAQLACLEAFRLDGYGKVLSCASDLLFRRPVDDLLDADEALICCGDRAAAKGWHLDAQTYRPIDPNASGAENGRALREPFDSGMMLIDSGLGGERTYGELLARMEGRQWRRLGQEVTLSGRPILNRYFAGRQTLVSWTYNYLLPEAADIQAREGLAAGDAKVLHFGGLKPWLPALAAGPWIRGGSEGYMTSAFKDWYDAYMDTLVAAALRNSRFEQRPAS